MIKNVKDKKKKIDSKQVVKSRGTKVKLSYKVAKTSPKRNSNQDKIIKRRENERSTKLFKHAINFSNMLFEHSIDLVKQKNRQANVEYVQIALSPFIKTSKGKKVNYY